MTWERSEDRPEETRAVNRVGFLFLAYEVRFWYWELTEMLRKLVMTALLVFVYDGEPAQIAGGMVFTFVFIIATLALQPFVTGGLNSLQAFSLSAQFLTLFVGLMTIINEANSNSASYSDGNKYATSVLVVLINCSTVVWPLFRMYITKKHDEYKEKLGMVLGICLPCLFGASDTDDGRSGTTREAAVKQAPSEVPHHSSQLVNAVRRASLANKDTSPTNVELQVDRAASSSNDRVLLVHDPDHNAAAGVLLPEPLQMSTQPTSKQYVAQVAEQPHNANSNGNGNNGPPPPPRETLSEPHHANGNGNRSGAPPRGRFSEDAGLWVPPRLSIAPIPPDSDMHSGARTTYIGGTDLVTAAVPAQAQPQPEPEQARGGAGRSGGGKKAVYVEDLPIYEC